MAKEIRRVSLDVTLSHKDRRDILKLFDGIKKVKVRKILSAATLYVKVEVEIEEKVFKTA